MKKVLIATEKPFAAAAVKSIRDVVEKAGYQLILLEKYTDHNDFVNAVSDADALIIRSDKANRKVIEAGKNLKIIVRAGAGYDNIDLESATEKGVVAMNTPGQNSNAVAELALGMMVYMARGCFDGGTGTELRGKKLGILAYGNVGKCVGTIAKGFGMELFGYDPYVPAEVMETDGVKVVGTVNELFSACRYVSLHIPANSETKGSVNYDLMSRMPKGATLVNTARKEIICEASLLKVYAEREDFKYVTDVAPDCAAQLLEKYPKRYYATPKKMGAQTSEANNNAGMAAARQIVDFFENGDTRYKVN